MKSIQKEAKKWMFENQTNISGLAEKVQMTVKALYKIFHSNDLKISQLESISKVIGVKISYWFEEENSLHNKKVNTKIIDEITPEMRDSTLELLYAQKKIIQLQEQLLKLESTKKG